MIKPAPKKKKQPIDLTGSSFRWLGLIVFLFALGLYTNTYRNKYALDDHLVTYPNQQITKGLKAIPEILTTRYAEEEQLSYGYRPLVKITYAMEYALWDFKPGRSHIINALLYALTCLLVYLVLRRLFRNYTPFFPFLITLLFAAHPLHTEVVASLKNRDEILGFLFNLAAFLTLLRYTDTRKRRYLILTVFLFLLVLLSKPTAAVFFIIFPLALYFFTGAKPRPLVYSGVAFLVVVLLFLVFTKFILPANIRPVQYYENPLFFEKDLWVRLGTGATILLFYLRLLLFPDPLRFYYGYDMIPVTNLASAWAILSILIHAGLLVWAVYHFRKRHILSFAILFYLLTIAIYSNIVLPSPGMVAERYVYVASLGFCIALVWFIFRIFRLDPVAKTVSYPTMAGISVILLLILVPYSVKTIQRNPQWKDYLTLYESDIPHLKRSVKANMLYASMQTMVVLDTWDMDRQARGIELVQRHYKQALEIYPDNFEVLNNLGSFYTYTLEKHTEAVPYLVKATQIRPEEAAPYYNLAYAYQKLGDTSKAISFYEEGIGRDPENFPMRSDLANLYFRKGELQKAKQINFEMIRMDSSQRIPWVNLGNYLYRAGDSTGAIPYWERAVAIEPDYQLCMRISWYYLTQMDSARTWYYYNMAQRVKPRMKAEENK
jgi:Tfp pilus assembly protein PilF